MSEEFRCGTVALVGRPNVGKSTFLNNALGMKLSITANKPQTTRNRVLGIYNDDGVQMVLVDTPGHHEAWSPLNRSLVRAAEQAIAEVDVVALMVDLMPAVHQARTERAVLSEGERVLLARIAQAKVPCVLVLNKVDAVDRDLVLPVIDAWRTEHDFAAVVPMAAIKKAQTQRLLDILTQQLPFHPPLYPTDQVTDSSERFVVSEIIREKLVRELQKELPYATAVMVEQFQEELDPSGNGERTRVKIFARILVERASQKGIVIGKGGKTLKHIGVLARKDIIRLLDCRVHLDLHVAVAKDWTRNTRKLKEFGYEEA